MTGSGNLIPCRAAELRVPFWIDGDGVERGPLRLAELGAGVKILYCFQHWCQGCHSIGFPMLKHLVAQFSNRVGFAVVQTVFEGGHVNTVEKLRETQLRYDLVLPFGHDPDQGGQGLSTVMQDYRTNGTPWFIVINPNGEIVFSDFHIDDWAQGNWLEELERPPA